MKKIFNVLSKIKRVDGRLELVKSFCNNIKVFVDFAHTPDALINSLKALKTQEKISQQFLDVAEIEILLKGL